MSDWIPSVQQFEVHTRISSEPPNKNNFKAQDNNKSRWLATDITSNCYTLRDLSLMVTYASIGFQKLSSICEEARPPCLLAKHSFATKF